MKDFDDRAYFQEQNGSVASVEVHTVTVQLGGVCAALREALLVACIHCLQAHFNWTEDLFTCMEGALFRA